MGFLSFYFEQFFFDRSVANLMMLTIHVCLIVFCLKSFICIAHGVALIPFCYIALLFIHQSIDREQIFDVTFQTPSLKNLAYATETLR